MRYTYKVRELTPHTEDSVDVGEVKEMQAMSFKKLRLKLDPVSYTHLTLPTTPYV